MASQFIGSSDPNVGREYIVYYMNAHEGNRRIIELIMGNNSLQMKCQLVDASSLANPRAILRGTPTVIVKKTNERYEGTKAYDFLEDVAKSELHVYDGLGGQRSGYERPASQIAGTSITRGGHVVQANPIDSMFNVKGEYGWGDGTKCTSGSLSGGGSDVPERREERHEYDPCEFDKYITRS